jgi:hypothetical protein
MVKIFLSWSGERSKSMAELLSKWLPRVIQNCCTWTSERDIEKGLPWFEQIEKTLNEYNFGIICTTPENYSAPWLLFEAGALSKSIGGSRVCPLLLGMSPGELSGPLKQFQATVFEINDMLKLVQTINSRLGDRMIDHDILLDCFTKYWTDCEAEMSRIAKISIPGNEITIDRVVQAFSKHGLPSPLIGNEAHFNSGYESHGLYSTVMELAQQRLHIFGRKNRKLFDKEHEDFFSQLPELMANGLDFRVLFLDPDAPEYILNSAHKDGNFHDQLRKGIEDAAHILKRNGVDPSICCRRYSIFRASSIIIVDDAVLFSPVRISQDGKVEKLTKAPFTIMNADTPVGKELCNIFDSAWENGIAFEAGCYG